MRHTYEVVGMHCQSCVGKVTDALQRVDGVTSAQVSLNPPTARVDMSMHVPMAELNRAVQTAGDYRIVEAAAEPGAHAEADAAIDPPPRESLYPLFLIVGYLLGTIALVAIATGERSPHVLMRHFMGGFFLVFSFFKLLDLRGFTDAYRSYDVLAGAWPAWGLVYPLVELALGGAYLLDLYPVATNVVTLALMLIGAVGVLEALLDKRAIRCACLGTALNLPMTTITLVEDLGMAAMAAVMLAIGWR
jgi:copper chaperone CopZ